jgi:short-subunit dehydrogenase
MSYAIVTGASKGIGKAIARELAKKGFNLLLIARSEALLATLAEELKFEFQNKVLYLPNDLSNPNSSQEILDFVQENTLPISVLVNNAGYGLWGRFEKLPIADQLNMLRLNNDSILSLTYNFLPILKQQKSAYILNVASTTAYQAVPFMSVYAASKSFVVAFSRGLSVELKNTNVSVTCLSPGATFSSFMDRAGMNEEKIIKASEKIAMTADDVASQAVAALFNKKKEFIPGFINKLSTFFTYLLPKSTIEAVVERIYFKD